PANRFQGFEGDRLPAGDGRGRGRERARGRLAWTGAQSAVVASAVAQQQGSGVPGAATDSVQSAESYEPESDGFASLPRETQSAEAVRAAAQYREDGAVGAAAAEGSAGRENGYAGTQCSAGAEGHRAAE